MLPQPLCSWARGSLTEVAEQGNWPLSPEWVTPSTRWLKPSSAEVSLQWTCTCDTTIFMAFAHSERSIHTPLPQTFLSSMFPSCSSQIPDHPSKPWATAHESHIITHVAISPSKQRERPGAELDVLRGEDFPSPRLRRAAQGGAVVFSGPLLVVPAGHAEYSTPVLSEEEAKRNLAGKVGPEELPSRHFITARERSVSSWEHAEKARFSLFKHFFLDYCLS